ncbi:MAG: VWA domain-containing protein [Prevotella sp.]|nr:VWA domain-containing protein [Prevotella sp.]
MFRFEDPQYLYLLVVVAVLAVIRLITYRNQKRRLRKFGDPVLLRQLMPDVSRWRPGVKFCLLEAALALLIVMLARPQFGSRISEEKRAGIETIICLDISNSMRARDVSPSRLDRAKMMVENMVDRFTDDKIGLIVFAGDAFVQLPITSDYVSAKMFLSSIDPSMMVNQGTDIAAAVSMASHSFTHQENIGKAIIVITDGEDHEGGAMEAAKDARSRGMNVFVLGVGSTKGAPIPDASGSYMTDRTGETVMSRLNEQMCREIAQAGGGAYIHVENNSNAQRQLDDQLDKLQKSETSIYSDFDEQFQAVGIIALLLLILEICILDRKNPALKKVRLFKKSTVPAACFLMLFALGVSPLHAQNNSQARKYIRKGNKEFRADKRQEAQVTYLKALEADTTFAPAMYNLVTSMFPQDWKTVEQEQRGQMIQGLMKAAQAEENPIRKSKAYHNIGVLYQGAQDFKMAIEAYKEALRNNPHDDEARYNLVLCQKQLKDDGQDQNQQGDNKDQQDDKQKQEQQQPQQQQQKQDEQQQEPPMSKENAEQLLQAAMQQEKQTQKRLKEQQMQQQRRQVEKNW